MSQAGNAHCLPQRPALVLLTPGQGLCAAALLGGRVRASLSAEILADAEPGGVRTMKKWSRVWARVK